MPSVSAGVKGQVWTVGEPVEKPMAHRCKADDARCHEIARPEVPNESERCPPNDRHKQAMGPRIVVKIQRSEPRVTGLNTRMLPAQGPENLPEDIGKQCCSENHNQWCASGEAFGC